MNTRKPPRRFVTLRLAPEQDDTKYSPQIEFVCPCGALLPRSGYALAQLAQGHDLTTICDQCKREVHVQASDARAFRAAHPFKRKKVAP